MKERNPNSGHGHVFSRPDGVKARCGGPSVCRECSRDLALITFSDVSNAVIRCKTAVARHALGIVALTEIELLQRLESLWADGFEAGSALAKPATPPVVHPPEKSCADPHCVDGHVPGGPDGEPEPCTNCQPAAGAPG